MKNILMLTSADALADPVTNRKTAPYIEQLPEYEYFAQELLKQGIRLGITKPRYFLDGTNRGWVFDGKEYVRDRMPAIDTLFERIVNDESSYSYVKEVSESQGIKTVNNTHLTDVCADKLLTSQTFNEAIPSAILGKDYSSVLSLASRYPGKIVLKPRFGAKGEDIYVVDDISKDTLDSIDIKTEYIAQPFIDSTCGIPELGIEGMFDLRLLIAGDNIVESFVRTPKKGSYLSNCAQGGEAIIIEDPETTVPEEFIATARSVIAYFKNYGNNLYSIDMIKNSSMKRAMIVELNSKPGFTSWEPGIAEEDRLLMDEYVKILKNESH